MTIQYERPVSHAAHWARRMALFSCLLFIAAVLSHRFGPLTTPHFLVLAGFAAVMAGLAVLLAAVGLARLWHVGARGGKAALTALLFSLLPLGVAGASAYAYFYKPALYDVTTDTVAAPPWLSEPSAEQDWLPRVGIVTARDRTVQLEAYPGLSGRRYDGALDRVYQGVRKVATAYGITITAENGLDNILADLEDLVVDPNKASASEEPLGDVPIPEARPLETPVIPRIGGPGDVLLQGEWRSPLFGFRFDVVIRLREEAETTLVDMRAASRYGPHDLGIGAELVEGYLKALDAELLGIAGD
ncbi:DUF1499 domain-containing protein [Shinella sp. CPCC 100929]|uniref:DUF1499 domain-containing protein n=1 Tax=Shinella lacus TaxID=2654216 RepID=A0ABT1RA42_9HYPH|nr:DUF1499 domain-containing protein [Shinella lacus]